MTKGLGVLLGRGRRLNVHTSLGVLAAFLVLAGAPLQAAGTESGRHRDALGLSPQENALRYIDVGDAPIPPLNSSLQTLGVLRDSVGGAQMLSALRQALQDEEVDTIEWYALVAVHDITGDGVQDSMVIHGIWTLSIGIDEFGFPTFSVDGKATYSARHGRTGRKLWEITEKSTDGFIGVLEGRVGRTAAPGFIVYKRQGMSTSQPWVELVAISGHDARRLWESRLDATFIDGGSPLGATGTTQNDPWMTGRGDFAGSQATDLLMALVTYVMIDYDIVFYDTGVAVIDGATGERIDHPDRERAVSWTPLPSPVGDQDGDSFRDYVFGNNFGVLVDVPDSEDPEPSVQVGGIMRARKGSTGEEIWAIGGLDLGRGAYAHSVSDQFGTRLPELFIVVWDYELDLLGVPIPLPISFILDSRFWWRTYVIDGEGLVRFEKPIWLIHAPGHINDDDEGDFIGWRPRLGGSNGVRVRLDAFSSHGKKLWTRVHRSPALKGVCGDVCFGFVGVGIGRAGDLQPDGGKDLGVYVSEGNGAERMFDHYSVDGLTGHRLHRGGQELFFPGVSFDGRGADLLEIFFKENPLRIRSLDGTDESVLLGLTIGPKLMDIGRDGLFIDLGELNADACHDLLLTISTKSGSYAVVVDGGSGASLWSEVLDGPDRNISIDVSTDRNYRC